MTATASARRRRDFWALLGALALIAGLTALTGSLDGGRASAGTTGSSPGVFVTGSDQLDALAVDSVSAGGGLVSGSPFGNSGYTLGATAIDATSTYALVGYSDGSGAGVAEVSVRSTPPSVVGSATLPVVVGAVATAPVEFAMDPTNPDNAYMAINTPAGGVVYQVTLGSAGPTLAGAPLYNSGRYTGLKALVISPDGSTLYLSGGNTDRGFLISVPVADPSGVTVRTDTTGAVTDLAVDPAGRSIYFATSGGRVGDLPLPLTTTSTATWNVSAATFGLSSSSSLAISPDGSTLYLGGPDANQQGEVASATAATGVPIASHLLPVYSTPGVVAVAVTPDGSTVVVTGESSNDVTASTAYVFTLPAPGLGAIGDQQNEVSGAGVADMSSHNLAVTPDQSPVADLDGASGTAGQPVSFNAGGSTVAYGSIVSYEWSFGDGTPAVNTSVPTVTHTFSSQGTYTVSVVETDSAHNSLPPAPGVTGSVNTAGETPFFDSSAAASFSETVGISAPGTKAPPKSTTTTTPRHGRGPTSPVLTLDPALGPPGTIVTVTGQGFPKNTPITVSWSVSTGSVVIQSDASGNLPPHQLLILTPDVLGPRFAVASTTPAVKAAFLVVPNSSEPGGSDSTFLFRSEGP